MRSITTKTNTEGSLPIEKKNRKAPLSLGAQYIS